MPAFVIALVAVFCIDAAIFRGYATWLVAVLS